MPPPSLPKRDIIHQTGRQTHGSKVPLFVGIGRQNNVGIGRALGAHCGSGTYGISMTVRDKIDQLLSQPAVGDLGYPADQRSIASVMLCLTLLADSIDTMDSRLGPRGGPDDAVSPRLLASEAQDLSVQLELLTVQVRKLAKTIKKINQKK